MGASERTAPVALVAAESKPRVLVLLATYNGAQWLREQVDSILAQAGVDVHVLIGDDASRDSTADLVRSGWGGDGRIELRIADRGSGSAGANFRRLFREAKADGYDFIALADQDDVWHPDKLSRAIQALGKHAASGYSAAVRAFWEDGRQKVLPQRQQERAADFLFEGAGQGCTFVMTRVLFQKVQRFCLDHEADTESLHYHDWLIYLLARAWQCRWYFDQVPSIDYRQHDGNEIGSRGSLTAVFRRLGHIRNGWYGRQIANALRLYRLARPDDRFLARFGDVFSGRDTLPRRARLAAFVFRHGRRRPSDRVVLVLAALAGWF